MDIEKTRKDFPILINQSKLIYFDNACMTLRPQSVIDAVAKYYTDYPVCAGRSYYKLAEKLTNDVENVRKEVANFIGARKKEEIIFTKNTTEAINMVANGLGLKEGDRVLGTDKEHNSNLTPWLKLEKESGVIYETLLSDENNLFNLEAYKKAVRGAKVVAMVMTSNLDGTTLPVEDIIKIAHKEGALVILDAAQSVPHMPINVKKMDVDFLAFSGHKMCGPSGTGVLYGKHELLKKLSPLLVGGGAVAESQYDKYELLPLPECLEAGLQNYAGILGFGEAVKYIKKVGFKNIAEQELKLNKYVTEGIEGIEGLKIVGPRSPELRSGIITFYFDTDRSAEFAVTLDNMAGVAVRSGQFCVHSWFDARGVSSAVRASFYFYNTMKEAEKFVETVKKITQVYK